MGDKAQDEKKVVQNTFSKEQRQVSEKIKTSQQLLDEAEHDIMNYQNRALSFLSKPKAEANNTDTWFKNSCCQLLPKTEFDTSL